MDLNSWPRKKTFQNLGLCWRLLIGFNPAHENKNIVEYLQTNECHISAASLQEISMGYENDIMPKPLSGNHSVNIC